VRGTIERELSEWEKALHKEVWTQTLEERFADEDRVIREAPARAREHELLTEAAPTF
jgi:hypothetical protein